MRKGENPSEVLDAIHQKVDDLNNNILPVGVKIDTFYDRTNLMDFAQHTVLHNLFEGIILVTVIVFLFMADWRTTVTVSIIIPLSLLFAFICMRIKGMTANLLSLGAVDFGIIIDGAVVMVEGLFVVLDQKAREVGMEKFNKLANWACLKTPVLKWVSLFSFQNLSSLLVLFPYFLFRKLKEKCFRRWLIHLAFALLGALILNLNFCACIIKHPAQKKCKRKT